MYIRNRRNERILARRVRQNELDVLRMADVLSKTITRLDEHRSRTATQLALRVDVSPEFSKRLDEFHKELADLKADIATLSVAPAAPAAPADITNGEGVPQVGGNVRWCSSNTWKTGKITHIVPMGRLPSDVDAKVKDAGAPRDHTSYIVRGHAVDQNNCKVGDMSTYWPRVSLLTFL